MNSFKLLKYIISCYQSTKSKAIAKLNNKLQRSDNSGLYRNVQCFPVAGSSKLGQEKQKVASSCKKAKKQKHQKPKQKHNTDTSIK